MVGAFSPNPVQLTKQVVRERGPAGGPSFSFSFCPSQTRRGCPHPLLRSSGLVFELRGKGWDSMVCPAHAGYTRQPCRKGGAGFTCGAPPEKPVSPLRGSFFLSQPYPGLHPTPWATFATRLTALIIGWRRTSSCPGSARTPNGKRASAFSLWTKALGNRCSSPGIAGTAENSPARSPRRATCAKGQVPGRHKGKIPSSLPKARALPIHAKSGRERGPRSEAECH
jgi:hypothetical protein